LKAADCEINMNNKNSKLDKVAGAIKESTGKIIGSEQLVLKGKLQKKRGEIKEAVKELGEDLKEKASEKLNDLIDKHDKRENKVD
jgi:uncharacterized protein YjbJ (UPF0337 family)